MYVYYVYYLYIICLHHSILPSELLGDCFILLWFSMLVYLSQNMYKCENVLLNNHFQSLCAD